jgi:putative transcriptional regulator
MTIAHHPQPETLMAYASGTLDQAYTVVIAAHLAMCDACRGEVVHLEDVGGAILEEEAEAKVGASALDRLLSAIDASPEEETHPEPVKRHEGVPTPLAPYLEGGLDSIEWKRKGPKAWLAELEVPANSHSRLLLLKVGAGAAMPEHGHGGHELTLILSGAYNDRFGRFAAGDLADHDDDVDHQPIAEEGEDCICLVAVDAPLAFKSRLMRVLQPLTGL